MALQNQSLRTRLLISAALLMVVFLGIMGIGLNKAFERSVLSNAEESLRNQILLLMSNIDVVDNRLSIVNDLLEPRLLQPDSDLFAQIIRPEEGVVWRSPSLLEGEMPEVVGALGEFYFASEFVWQGQPASYATALNVEWETDQGDFPFTIQVSERRANYNQRVENYGQQILTWLSVMGASLLVLLLLLFGWALKPLKRVTQQVSEIEQGQRQRFDEDYPKEVSRLTQNLNQLLNVEENRIIRQKEVLGNLAHSLKTPIAVLKGIKYADINKKDVETELGTIQNIIDYQLQTASTVGRRRFAKPVLIKPLTDKILHSLNKLYADKALTVEVDIEPTACFYGDEGDWMELCGNLLENAFKWTSSKVSITVVNKDQGSSRKAIEIKISDDGPGIDEQAKKLILERGVRLDSQTPGHGLGLSIVKGIVDAYNGEIMVADNQPQGTVFKVELL